MKSRQLKGFVAICALSVVWTPPKALAGLYEPASWTAHSFYGGRMVGLPAPGIGGLQIDISSSLALSPSDLSYKDGYLQARYKGRLLKVPISQPELYEAIKLIRSSNDKVFQSSLDRVAVENRQVFYQSESLRKNTVLLANLFRIADFEHSAMVQGRIPLPKNGPIHPYDLALQLLAGNNAYASLPTQWKEPPSDWPQVFLSFSSTAPELVRISSNPQVFFLSPSGHPIQVSESIQSLGKQPYTQLMDDIKRRPEAYRAVLPAVNRTAYITAALGLVSAGCKQPKSCTQLLSELKKDEIEKVATDYRSYEQRVIDSEKRESRSRQNLTLQWEERSLQTFKPGQTPQAWGNAYDAVQQNISLTYSYWDVLDDKDRLDKEDELLKQREILFDQSWKIAAQQFLHYPVPNDARLQAALAVILVQTKGEDNPIKALESINQAIKLSENNPGDRIEVARMGLYVGRYLQRLGVKEASEELVRVMYYYFKDAQTKAYDEVDRYLITCIKSISSCSTQDLLTWEADSVRAGLYRKIESRDTAWLYGRFSYLIGIKEPKWGKDRLRLLSAYTQAVQNEHKQELTKMQEDLGRRVTSR